MTICIRSFGKWLTVIVVHAIGTSITYRAEIGASFIVKCNSDVVTSIEVSNFELLIKTPAGIGDSRATLCHLRWWVSIKLWRWKVEISFAGRHSNKVDTDENCSETVIAITGKLWDTVNCWSASDQWIVFRFKMSIKGNDRRLGRRRKERGAGNWPSGQQILIDHVLSENVNRKKRCVCRVCISWLWQKRLVEWRSRRGMFHYFITSFIPLPLAEETPLKR